jgi:hypothetical protein
VEKKKLVEEEEEMSRGGCALVRRAWKSRLMAVGFAGVVLGCAEKEESARGIVAQQTEQIHRGIDDDGPTMDPYRNAIVRTG